MDPTLRDGPSELAEVRSRGAVLDERPGDLFRNNVIATIPGQEPAVEVKVGGRPGWLPADWAERRSVPDHLRAQVGRFPLRRGGEVASENASHVALVAHQFHVKHPCGDGSVRCPGSFATAPGAAIRPGVRGECLAGHQPAVAEHQGAACRLGPFKTLILTVHNLPGILGPRLFPDEGIVPRLVSPCQEWQGLRSCLRVSGPSSSR